MKILDTVTAIGAGAANGLNAPYVSFQLVGATSAGAGAVSCDVEVSDDGGQNWDIAGTISLTLGATPTSDSFTAVMAYELVRGKVTAISGTGANVSLWMGAKSGN